MLLNFGQRINGVAQVSFIVEDSRKSPAIFAEKLTSHVHAEQIVDCPFGIAPEYAVRFLSDFQAPRSDTVRVPLAALGLPLPGALKHRVKLSFGMYSDVPHFGRRHHDEIHFRWSAEAFWLPDFSGTLRFGIASHCKTLLLLDGMYRPPFGILGALFDTLIGHHVAAATLRDLLAHVADALESDERAFRAAHLPAS